MLKTIMNYFFPKKTKKTNIKTESADNGLKKTIISDLPMDKILELRDSIFAQYTREIFKKVENKLNYVAEHTLNLPNKIIWKMIEMTDIKGFVTVAGSIYPSIGDTIISDGKEILIDKNNMMLFVKPLQMHVPVMLLEYGTPEQLLKFIKDLTFLSELLGDIEVKTLLYNMPMTNLNMDNVFHIEKYEQLLDDKTKPDDADNKDFDMTVLSETQLKMFVNISNSVKH